MSDVLTTATKRKTKTPRNVDAILKGALSLSLSDKVRLKATLENSIEEEVKEKEKQLALAKEIVNGRPH